MEPLFIIESLDALRRCLEVELERPLDGDLAKAEMGGREDLAEFAFLEFGKDPEDLLPTLERDLAALGSEVFDRNPERRGIDELNPAPPLRRLAICQQPDVG